MEAYAFLRNFADSWHLAFMTLFFIGVFVWALRPGANKVHEDVSNSIFRNEDRPASLDAQPVKEA